ncbi:MAG: hypothetical protein VW687_02090, partial [Curvibacter sp.]
MAIAQPWEEALRYFGTFFREFIEAAAERGLSALSIYVIPIAVGVVSISALIFWDAHYDAHPEQQLGLRALIETSEALAPEEALAQLAGTPATRQFETRLSERPVWFALDLREAPATGRAIELPSRHRVALSCWDA